MDAFHFPRCVALAVIILGAAACPSPHWNLVQEEDLEEGEGVFHVVAKGESLFRIAKLYDADLQEIAEDNDLDDPAAIKPGDRLFIPGGKKPGTAPPPEEKPRKDQKAVRADHGKPLPPAKGDDEPQPARYKGTFIWPAKGVVTSRFGVRHGNKHQGIDIGAPKGTPVLAAGAGKVIYSDNKLRGYGNLIIVRHDGGLITVYAHNSENRVREGDMVARGQTIAAVGDTGNAESPHLHFEVREGSKPRNPLFFLP